MCKARSNYNCRYLSVVFVRSQANLAVQEVRLGVAEADLNKAQAQLDEKQAELDAAQAMYDKAVQEKQVKQVFNLSMSKISLLLKATSLLHNVF